MPALLSEKQLNNYSSKGYLHLTNIYSTEDILKVRRLIEEDIGNNSWEQAPYFTDSITTDVFERIPGLADIIFNERYLKAMIALFSPEPVLLAEPAIHRSRYFYWHKDSTFLDEQGLDFHWQPEFRAAMTVMYLQDNNPVHGGGISLIPGTHLLPDYYHKVSKMNLLERALLKLKKVFKRSHYDKLDRHPDLSTIPTNTGDLLVLDLRIDHKGTPAFKPSPTTKYAIMNIACSGYEVADKIRMALRKRPSPYYQQYLAKQPLITPTLERIGNENDIAIWL